jgi:hypothetical protein
MTKCEEKRLHKYLSERYGTAYGCHVKLDLYKQVTNYLREVEAHVHNYLKKYRVGGEIFCCDLDVVQDAFDSVPTEITSIPIIPVVHRCLCHGKHNMFMVRYSLYHPYDTYIGSTECFICTCAEPKQEPNDTALLVYPLHDADSNDQNLRFITHGITESTIQDMLSSTPTEAFKLFIQTLFKHENNCVVVQASNTCYRVHIGNNEWEVLDDCEVLPRIVHYITAVALELLKRFEIPRSHVFHNYIREAHENEASDPYYEAIFVIRKFIARQTNTSRRNAMTATFV